MPDYTTTGLVEQVKIRASVPTAQTLFTTSRIIGLLNDELLTFIVPFIMEVREEFFVVYKDTSIDTDTREYEVPSRAIGNKLREVTLVSNGQEIGRLIRYAPERVIGILGDPCPDGTCEITGTIHIFPAGTDNATACAAYDQWRETGELPGGVTTA